MRPRSSAPQNAKRTPARAWIGSVEANFACLGREQTADSVDDGALARTVGAEQRHAFPGGNRERHAPDHLVVAIGDFEISERARCAPAPGILRQVYGGGAVGFTPAFFARLIDFGGVILEALVVARHLVPSTQSSTFAGRGRSVTSLVIC